MKTLLVALALGCAALAWASPSPDRAPAALQGKAAPRPAPKPPESPRPAPESPRPPPESARPDAGNYDEED